jgi:hypothetical protein
MIVAGVAIVTITGTWLRTEDQRARAAAAARDQMRGTLLRAHQEQTEIRQKIARFHQLAQTGVLGEERRLDWIERIKEIESARRLSEVRFEMSPRRPIDPAFAPGPSGSFEFYASSMRLEMTLLHEGDLIGLIEDLRGSVGALLRPRQCLIERLPGAEPRPAEAQLRAACTIDWITIREQPS